ncbi:MULTISPECIES: tetratricopeptide repeat protein [unclassified Luteimonas]|uniref:tetratricopeptide repeat protein n=1 Tax=unclassified Luteimonas TaxID=2629088 RepID=UPI0018F0B739|nr:MULTISPECIES: tetratricopeptide repeat protein [unclassified Luteimonas]MBJ6979791.1 tetratricopeptide repeat protein [Luteimonas sp. MC1895]MBJ6985517.1 tetratricopeptide repeat protein [Luteimonas sp. MC1750]QQO05997.1 tetratricopeptide repeat protein [Luteimonas sp. MC1750]
MNHVSARRLAVLVLALLPFGLCAQNLPWPKEFYFESDADVARPLELYPGTDDATVERLLQARRNGRRDANLATAQLAHLSYAGGRAETGAALYQEALQRPDNARQRDALHWNHGWDLYRSGDVAGAIEQWRIAGAERLKGPAWLPPTLALGLWQLDRRDEAVRWYAAAVRTEPALWTTPDLQRLLPGWSQADRDVLAQVAAAWKVAPPPWP